MPIYGALVPFHIACVKSITYSQDGEMSHSIRVIFNVPGSTGPEGFLPAVDFPNHLFLKELSFRSRDGARAARVVQETKALQREVKNRDKERLERASLSRQVGLLGVDLLGVDLLLL